MTTEEKRLNRNAYMRAWNARNADKCRQRAKEYRARNPDVFKKWYQKNREQEVSRVKKYYRLNRERVLSVHAKRRAANSERHRKYARDYYHADPARALRKKREYISANREAYNARRRAKYAARPHVRARNSLCGRMRYALLAQGITVKSRTMSLLGCSLDDFQLYLESKFESGMTWENYGSVWEIDHIIPCALFDLTRPEHQRRCFHFSNMQPMFGIDNKRKGCRVKTPQMHLL